MKIGVVGLGLIGGSLAKAFKHEKETVFATDKNPTVEQIAGLLGVIDGKLNEELGNCDYVFIAIDAENTVKYIENNARAFKKGCVVVDCCGVKEVICEKCFDVANKNGFTFIGGHPMAGTQYSGFKYSKHDLFYGTNMVLVPKEDEELEVLSNLKNVLKKAGFGSVSITTAKKHDEVIAFTSQLAHVVSNAYVKSPNATVHKGFSAGSYKDLTRVAWLNEEMWAKLFLQNKQNISFEIRNLIDELKKYDDAINNDDYQTLKDLLKEGRERKEHCD